MNKEMIMKNSTEDQVFFAKALEKDQLIDRLFEEIAALEKENTDLREALHMEIYS
jgi:hypothetical protein